MYSHGFLKVAAASPSVRVGDTIYNVKEMIKAIEEASKKDPAIICFPELCISGYSIGDMVFQKYLYDDTQEAIQYLLDNNPYSGVIIFGSYFFINDIILNCGFVVQKNKILGIIPKNFLPHTNEFYEARYFAFGEEISNALNDVVFLGQKVPFGKIIFENEEEDVKFGAEICADMWSPESPNDHLYANGAMIVFNSSASPSYVGKKDKRRLLTQSISMKWNAAYVYVSNNASESTSEVVFSGHKIITENGDIITEDDEILLTNSIIYGDIDIQKLHFLRRNNSYYKILQDTARDLNIVRVRFDLKKTKEYRFEKVMDKLPWVPKRNQDFLDIINIQAASIVKRLDYVGTNKVIIGVSGGLDSTLALLSLCYGFDKYKIDRKNIIAITMPSKQTSKNTYINAKEICEKLNVTFKEVPIQDDVNRQLSAIGHNEEDKDITYENVQARFRTYTMMNCANLEKAIVIGTSNMSEVALGWSTFGGDQTAMYGLNAGLTKTVIKATVNFYKTIFPEVSTIIDSILATPISPELTSSNQKTEDIIGKYEINDFILYRFLVEGDDEKRLIYLICYVFKISTEEASNYVDNFNRRFYSQQFKRLSMPEGVKILTMSLSPRTELRLNGDIYRNSVKK